MDNAVTYARLYADAKGESHIEEGLCLGMASTDFVPPAPPILVSGLQPASAYAFLSVPVAYFGDFHPSPKRQWLFFLSGEMEFEVSDGQRLLGKPGLAILLEDTTGLGHKSTVKSAVPALMVAVQT
ncbi:cupin domain-containing protein [Cupriavidus sp. 2TAF22]|uniref:cupin domain-containing protein n=1 Tax=unclassified Cupriavidus TaxID=2640874 RepID=UPI003F8FADAE